ncbi:hypothetical protein OIO90_005914 [Microbotryomycetes sp. JL221]|nr:hypothetical protein OIO90_005914 [Microbotryomycetes sp. JL221]
MSYSGSDKRRRLDDGYGSSAGLYVAPSTSRTAAKARHDRAAHEAALKQATTRPKDDLPAPVLDLATLPPAALQRYLSRYGLLEPHGGLSYHHAVFPTPPLANAVEPPLHGRSLQFKRHASVFPQPDSLPGSSQPATSTSTSTSHVGDKQAQQPQGVLDQAPPPHMAVTADERHKVDEAVAQGQQPAAVTVSKGKKRAWHEPKAVEFARVSAYDDPQLVINRLAQRASAHFTTREGIKEGEFLTNFMFALRMRSHTLRATPPG